MKQIKNRLIKIFHHNRKEYYSRDCFTLNTEDIVMINIHDSGVYDHIAYYTGRKVIVGNFNKIGTTGVVPSIYL